MKLKELRRKQGITQAELANRIGVVESAISLYESGKREPDISTLIKIAKCLNTTVDYLIDMPSNANNKTQQQQKEESLTEDEKQLLKAYRSLIPSMKEHLLSMAESLSIAEIARKKNNLA